MAYNAADTRHRPVTRALAPTTADQIDLTYEWYFSNTGSLTLAVFAKNFNDYIQYGSYIREFTNNGVTRDVSVTGPITGDGAKLPGFEVAYQQFFDALPEPWNGLGVQANYTYVDNQGITNSDLTTVSGSGNTQQDPLITFTDLPLEGYSPQVLQPGADVRAAEVRGASRLELA